MAAENALIISDVKAADIAQMIDICAQNLIENNDKKFTAAEFSQKGFLVKKLTKEDVEEILQDQKNQFVCVAKEGEEVLGYLIGCDVSKTKINFLKYWPDFKKSEKGKFFYHKQIVKKPEAKNVGKKLLLAMFDEAKIRSYSQVICRIVHKPFFNQASINFHQKFGFNQVTTMEESGMMLGIYQKNL
jgi:predicted GNAT superfamily acetyltransferase